jgi:hypothetical protein
VSGCASSPALFVSDKKIGKFLPRSGDADQEALLVYRALGVALIRTIVDERVVEAPFATALFKFLLGARCDLGDLEAFDEVEHRNMLYLLGSQEDEYEDYGFAMAGATEDTNVTRHNKRQFVQQYVDWHLIGSRSAALHAMKEGFLSMGEDVNLHLRALTWRDLQVLLSGPSYLEPSMVIERLDFTGFAADSLTPQHLRDVLSSMKAEALKTFLVFCTASPSLPVGATVTPIIKVIAAPNSSALPTSPACFLRLVLPDYRDAQLLRTKLTMALELTDSSFTKA